MILRRLAPPVAVAISILSSAMATDAQPDVVALLKSRDARQQAWGAWHAGTGQLRELAPLVNDVVREYVRYSAEPTLDVAVDALVQLRAPPSTRNCCRVSMRFVLRRH